MARCLCDSTHVKSNYLIIPYAIISYVARGCLCYIKCQAAPHGAVVYDMADSKEYKILLSRFVQMTTGRKKAGEKCHMYVPISIQLTTVMVVF